MLCICDDSKKVKCELVCETIHVAVMCCTYYQNVHYQNREVTYFSYDDVAYTLQGSNKIYGCLPYENSSQNTGKYRVPFEMSMLLFRVFC